MLSMLRRKMKAIMVTVAVLFAASMFYGLGYMGYKNVEGPGKGSIATINGKEIDHAKYQLTVRNLLLAEKGRVKPEKAMLYQTLALGEIIDSTLILNEAKRRFRVGRSELDQTIAQIALNNKLPDINALKAALKNMGQDYNEFRKDIKDQILIAKMIDRVKGAVVVNPEDLREVSARHILIMPRSADESGEFQARAKAEDLLAQIRKGADFASLAVKYSDDKASAVKGGDLGYFTTGSLVPEFEKVAFSLKPGEMSDVIRTPYGYHIILVEDTRLRQVREKGKDISEVVLNEKRDNELKRWIVDLRKKAKIEINAPLLKAHSYLLGGRMDEAISFYNQAIQEDPSNAYAYLFLSDAYVKADKGDLALLQLDKASQYSGADPSLLIAVADDYIKLGKRQLALEQYRRASMISGDNKDMHVELKSIFNKLGAVADASKEQAEINRIERKEKFEKEIQQKMGK